LLPSAEVTEGADLDAASAMVSLRKIIRYLRLGDREVEHASGLSSAQLFVLSTLAETPALSVAEVAKRALTDQSSVSTVVARLVQRGLIVRKPSTKDRRRAELRITPAGQRILQSAPPIPQMKVIDAIRSMPAQRRAELVHALDALIEAIGGEDIKPRMLFQDES
jgi:DNA-binding MarR family transcriptional regulator